MDWWSVKVNRGLTNGMFKPCLVHLIVRMVDCDGILNVEMMLSWSSIV